MYYNLFYEFIQVAIGRRGSLSRVPSAEEWSMLYGLALKFFELKTKESQEIVNSQLIEFLEEWRQDAPSRYRKAKDDVCYWITDEWYSFESPMQKEIESAYQTALKKKDDMAIALALSPFAQQTR